VHRIQNLYLTYCRWIMYIIECIYYQYIVHRIRSECQVETKGKFVLHQSKQKKGDAVYIYYMIAWYYRKNKKPFRDILKHLGRLEPDEIEYYNNCIACLNHDPEMFPCNIKKLSVQNSYEYLPCALGIHFWNYWNLSTVFNKNTNRKEVSTNYIALILTSLRFIQTCSKSYTTKLYKETTLPQLTGILPSLYNKSRIFRELEVIESHREELGKHIFEFAKHKGYTQGELLFYDLSSGNLTGLRCIMAKWGHCKDGYNTHVVLLLVITPEGYPIYWEILEGNTADAKTIESLILKTEKIYGKVESVICFDRGMVSDENLRLLEGKEIKFVTALDGNQVNYFEDIIDFDLIERIKKFDHKENRDEIEKELVDHGFNYIQYNLYCREIQLSESEQKKIEDKTNKLELDNRRYFFAFNPELSYLTDKHRKNRVEQFKEWIKEYNNELVKVLRNKKEETVEKAIKKEIKRRRIADVELNYDLEEYNVENENNKGEIKRSITYKIKLGDITEESYAKARKYDGLWVLITNITKNKDEEFFKRTKSNSYFEIYRLKNIIEEAFKILSNFVGIEPFYVYKTEHIKAHFTICVLSYLLDITILNKVRESDKIENMDLHTIFHELIKCRQNVIQIDEKKSVSKITKITEEQKKILDVLDCSYLVTLEYLYDRNIVST